MFTILIYVDMGSDSGFHHPTESHDSPVVIAKRQPARGSYGDLHQ
jgi:hypothetical protein